MRFATKKATADATRLTAIDAPGPTAARTGPSTSHPATDAASMAAKVGMTPGIGRTPRAL